MVKGALEDVLRRARDGRRVEVGYLGGHGRTGAALGCLAVMTGVAPVKAVGWVRDSYCAAAIETESQAAFVEEFQ